jgi:hemerythrin-like domain-containing protein
MSGLNAVARLLHDEHRRTTEVLSDLEERIMGRDRDRPWNIAADAGRRRLQTLVDVLDHDIARHFVFEEECLFPALSKAGYGELTAALVTDHLTIRSFAGDIRRLATAALAGGFDRAAWQDFRNVAMDLVPSVMFHIQKEEMTVVRRLSDLLDDETDRRLAEEHARFRG